MWERLFVWHSTLGLAGAVTVLSFAGLLFAYRKVNEHLIIISTDRYFI